MQTVQEIVSNAYRAVSSNSGDYGLAISDRQHEAMLIEFYNDKVKLRGARYRNIGGGIKKQRILTDARDTPRKGKASLANISASLIIRRAETRCPEIMRYLYEEPPSQQSYIAAVKSIMQHIDERTAWPVKTRQRLRNVAWLIALNLRKRVMGASDQYTAKQLSDVLGVDINGAKNIRRFNIKAINDHYIQLYNENMNDVEMFLLE